MVGRWIHFSFKNGPFSGLTFVKFFEGVISETPIASSHSHQRFPEQRKEPEQFGLFVFLGGCDGGSGVSSSMFVGLFVPILIHLPSSRWRKLPNKTWNRQGNLTGTPSTSTNFPRKIRVEVHSLKTNSSPLINCSQKERIVSPFPPFFRYLSLLILGLM